MAQIWPFPPSSEMIEAVTWWTEILPTMTTEQRLCRRVWPRRELSFTSAVRDSDAVRARGMMRNTMDGWLVPEWPSLQTINAHTGASVSLPDGDVVVWRNAGDYEQTTVSGGVLGTVASPGMARVMSLSSARQVGAWDMSRSAGGWGQHSVTFEICDTVDYGASGLYPDYNGYDFVNSGGGIFGSSSIAESFSYERETIDNQLAVPVEYLSRDVPVHTYQSRWWSRDATAFREWVYTRRGRWKAFWLPEYSQAMRLLGTGGAVVQVSNYDPSESHVCVMIDGVLHARPVLSYSAGSTSVALTLDGALPAGDAQAIYYLRLVRFASDRIEFLHKAASGVAVSVPVTMVVE